ncbi:pyridoxamine 5'-phosphate oxidase family protein [Fodinicola acaciae]|uniref:pyridoxamine 5'-phosphate oxidase family protein n=1 Tax=Fodinicola acaciae TaxID=2681555 RepID=UPI001FE76F61|nr:pyridoxamine 5'-phosphate oxidase family protein [Fodinicola acaciae]
MTRTIPLRYRDRMTDEQAAVYAILDEALVCHVSYILDGEPRILPTLHARVGDNLLLHGSSGSRLGLLAREYADGLPVCVAVTLIDGIVLARSAFNHSVNFRSVVVHGKARLVTDRERQQQALDAFINQLVPDRASHSRRANPQELAKTAVLELPLAEAAAKVRQDKSDFDDPEDLDLPHWAGTIPLHVTAGEPKPAPELLGAPVPDHVTGWTPTR